MPTYSASFGGRAGKEKSSNTSKEKKSKSKCPICRKSGHEGSECSRRPEGGIPPGGIEFGSKKSGAGSSIAHKQSKKFNNSNSNSSSTSNSHLLPLPPPFTRRSDHLDDPPPSFLFADADSDVSSVLDILSQTGGKKSKKTPETEYNVQLTKDTPWNFAGSIVRVTVHPKKGFNLDSEQNAKIIAALSPSLCWFSIGLSAGCLVSKNDAEDEDSDDSEFDGEEYSSETSSVSELFDSALTKNDSVVSLFSSLDYGKSTITKGGFDRKSQLRRLRTTMRCAHNNKVPVSVRLKNDEGTEEVEDLLNTILTYKPRALHLNAWSGTGEDMLRILKAGADADVQVYVGFSGNVAFSKATRHLKNSVFDCPLDRLLLETDGPNSIPTPVTNAYNRTAFSHAGLIPFVGDAVATARGAESCCVDVVRSASINLAKLYGGVVAESLSEAKASERRAEIEAEEQAEENCIDEESTDGVENNNDLESLNPELLPPPPPSPPKKKKTKGGKKKGVAEPTPQPDANELEEDFDDMFFNKKKL